MEAMEAQYGTVQGGEKARRRATAEIQCVASFVSVGSPRLSRSPETQQKTGTAAPGDKDFQLPDSLGSGWAVGAGEDSAILTTRTNNTGSTEQTDTEPSRGKDTGYQLPDSLGFGGSDSGDDSTDSSHALVLATRLPVVGRHNAHEDQDCMAVAVTKPVAGVGVPEGDSWRSPLSVPDLPRISTHSVTRGSLLGRGAFGSVFQAQVPGHTAPLAVKEIPLDKLHDPKFVQSLAREAEVLHALRGRGVPHLYGLVESDQSDFEVMGLAMELLQGWNLREFMASHPNLSARQRVVIKQGLLVALVTLHSHGIIHGDLKPDNVMVMAHSNVLTVKLIDFGLSLWATSGVVSASCQGTLTYMAPELCEGGRPQVTEAADMFSLGNVLYFINSGQEPYQGMWAREVQAALVNKDERALALVKPTRPDHIDISEWEVMQQFEAPACATEARSDHPDWDTITQCRAMHPSMRPAASDLMTRYSDPGAEIEHEGMTCDGTEHLLPAGVPDAPGLQHKPQSVLQLQLGVAVADTEVKEGAAQGMRDGVNAAQAAGKQPAAASVVDEVARPLSVQLTVEQQEHTLLTVVAEVKVTEVSAAHVEEGQLALSLPLIATQPDRQPALAGAAAAAVEVQVVCDSLHEQQEFGREGGLPVLTLGDDKTSGGKQQLAMTAAQPTRQLSLGGVTTAEEEEEQEEEEQRQCTHHEELAVAGAVAGEGCQLAWHDAMLAPGFHVNPARQHAKASRKAGASHAVSEPRRGLWAAVVSWGAHCFGSCCGRRQ